MGYKITGLPKDTSAYNFIINGVEYEPVKKRDERIFINGVEYRPKRVKS